MSPVEVMASLLGAVAHDLDHPGVNQPFLIATSNHLATLYDVRPCLLKKNSKIFTKNFIPEYVGLRKSPLAFSCGLFT